MQAMFKGTISFGLVNIPVKMFTATEEKDIRFRQLHRKCNTPIKYRKVCPSCGEEVPPDEIVRGFEYEPGKFVIISDEDVESAKAEAQARAIEIVDFVDLSEIDPIYFEKTYYLAPSPEAASSAKAYNLLREAMKQSSRIAVAKITIRDRQSLCVLRVYGKAFALETIFYPDEIRPVSEIPALPEETKADEKELSIAKQLIENLTTKFDPSKYADEYRESLQKVIEAKIQGREVAAAPEAPENKVIDLMEALKASLEMTRKEAAAR